MSEIEKYKKYLKFKANPRYLRRDFIVSLYTGTEPDIVSEANVDPGMVVDPSRILPKNFTDDMPFVTDENNPEQLELAGGGSVERREYTRGGKSSPNQGFQKGNVYYKQNIGKYKTDVEKLNSLRDYLKSLPKGTSIPLMTMENKFGVSRKTVRNLLDREFKSMLKPAGVGAQIANVQKINEEKIRLKEEKISKFKDDYLKDLKIKFQYPSGSPEASKLGVSNKDLAKKYFGDDSGKNIAQVERLNAKLTKEYELKYPKGNRSEVTLRRYARREEGKKYLSDLEKDILKRQTTQKKLLNNYFKNNPEEVYNNEKLKSLIDVKLTKEGNLDFTPRYQNKEQYKKLAQSGRIFDDFHTSPVRGEKRNIEYPVNKNIGPSKFNSGFIKQVESFFNRTKGNPDYNLKKKKINDFLDSFGYRIEIPGEGYIGAKALPAIDRATGRLPNIEKTLENLNLPKIKSTSEYMDPKKISALGKKQLTQMIAAIGCNQKVQALGLGGRVNFSNGSSCYMKGLEKIKSGELTSSERIIASQFLKKAGVGDELVKGMLTGGKNILKVFQEFALGTGTIGTLIGTTLTVPFAAAESARGSPGGFGRELVSSLIENVNIIPGVDIDAAKLAGTQVTQALERSARPGSQKMANYLFPIQEQSKEIDNLNKKLERFIYLRDNPSIESSPVSDQQVKMIQEQIDEKKLTLQNLTNNLKKNITGEDLNDVKKDIIALQAEAFKKAKNTANLRISNVANPEIKKYVQENPNRIVLNAENIPTFINNLSNEYGESARTLIDQITKNFENIKTLGQQGEEETGILSPSGFIDVTDIYNDFLKRSEGYKTIFDKQDLETKPLTEDQRISIEEMGARGGAAEGGYIDYIRDYNRYARGGRIHLNEGGGGPKLSRRGFLGFLAGAASLPFVSKLMKGKKGIQAAKVATKVLPKVAGMPDWFNPLVTKIMNEGIDISPKATRVEDIVKVKKLEVPVPGEPKPDIITMYEYPDGRIEISANVYGGSYDSPFDLIYKPPKTDMDVTTGIPIKEPGEFSVMENRPRPVYSPDDADYEIDYEKMNVEDAISDLERIEKIATGKRIPPQRVQKREKARAFVEDNPYDDIVNRYGDAGDIEFDRMKDEGLLDD